MKTIPLAIICKWKMILLSVLLVLLFQPFLAVGQGRSGLTSPVTYFGFEPGTNRKMFSYAALMGYLMRLEQESDMMQIKQIGQSEFGRPMYIVFISSPENINRLGELQEINRKLALDANLPENEREELLKSGRAFVMTNLSIHSNEVGPSQAAPLMAYNLVAEVEPDMHKYLENVVFMMIPSANPDGHDMMVEHYNKYLGTPYEGSTLPGVYHRYIGHNINRDFVNLNMSENRAIADIYNLHWHPHVMVDKHQMGMSGVRYFVPPNHDPIAQNIDPTLWNWSWVFGSAMARDMTARGLKGVSQQYLFDNYWPGSTETSLWKNTISLLTEAASARLATPVFIELGELGVSGKGLAEYQKSINMPAPWMGGEWGLEEIVEYEIASIFSVIRTASRQKIEILRGRNDLVRREVERGTTQAPFFYVLPANQHDKGELYGLLRLLARHGVEIYRLNANTTVNRNAFTSGDYVIPMAQPFRPFIKEVMEKQHYPVRHFTTDGEMIEPYDITSWSLPLHRGVESFEINTSKPELYEQISKVKVDELQVARLAEVGNFLIFTVNKNESFKAAFQSLARGIEVFRSTSDVTLNSGFFPKGSFLIRVTTRNRESVNNILKGLHTAPVSLSEKPSGFQQLRLPRIALVETWLHDMDAGWTRFMLDTYGIPFTVLRPSEMKGVNLQQRFDILIFADTRTDHLMYGASRRADERVFPFYPAGYAIGMEKEGWQNVLGFIFNGGTVLSWGRSVELFTGVMEPPSPQQPFRFPVDNISRNLMNRGLRIPGTFLKMQLIPNHPLTFGMPQITGVFHNDSPVLETQIPAFGMNRRVIGSFPEGEILLSGFGENLELIHRAPAMVWLQRGNGNVVLYSFLPNFRGGTPVSHKLIFNAILLPQAAK